LPRVASHLSAGSRSACATLLRDPPTKSTAQGVGEIQGSAFMACDWGVGSAPASITAQEQREFP